MSRGKLVSVIRLVRAELHLLDAALVSNDALAAVLGHDVVAGWATFTAALQTTRDAVAANTSGSPRGARFFVAGDPAGAGRAWRQGEVGRWARGGSCA